MAPLGFAHLRGTIAVFCHEEYCFSSTLLGLGGAREEWLIETQLAVFPDEARGKVRSGRNLRYIAALEGSPVDVSGAFVVFRFIVKSLFGDSDGRHGVALATSRALC